MVVAIELMRLTNKILQRVKDAIANDYDTRRAIEAAAMGGSGKAKKLAR